MMSKVKPHMSLGGGRQTCTPLLQLIVIIITDEVEAFRKIPKKVTVPLMMSKVKPHMSLGGVGKSGPFLNHHFNFILITDEIEVL